jgi:hypothetical protein
MFKRVGEEFPNPELTDQNEWYTKRTWTDAQEDDFRKWMIDKLRKEGRYTKKTAEWETSMFLLNWGWKNEEVADETV